MWESILNYINGKKTYIVAALTGVAIVVQAFGIVIPEVVWQMLAVLGLGAIRKMKAAIEAGEKYIQVNQKSGMFKDIDKGTQIKLLRHYSKRFFHYN